MAHEAIEFTHYDLSGNNIIIKTLDSPRDFEFNGVKASCRYLPVILDFGVSHIKYQGKDIGTSLQREYIYNKNFWIYDVYLLVSALYGDIYTSKICSPEILGYTRQLFEYFIRDPDINEIKYRLAYSEELSKASFDAFINYVTSI
jgi:hypothetical protein